MSFNTQDNTGVRASYGTNTSSTGNTGSEPLYHISTMSHPNRQAYNDPNLNPNYGFGDRDTNQGSILVTTERIADTGRTGYRSVPTTHGQGTTTGQYDSSRISEGGKESGVASSGQQQYGQDQEGSGTGVGHHKAHHEGYLHGHGPDVAAKANCEECIRNQAVGEFHCFIFDQLSFIIYLFF